MARRRDASVSRVLSAPSKRTQNEGGGCVMSTPSTMAADSEPSRARYHTLSPT